MSSPFTLSMMTDTKSLFAGLARALHCDCVFDIGSRDGDQSLFFRDILPGAVVAAFEAHPVNFKNMQAKERLQTARIDLHPCAVSNSNGTATFYAVDVDYNNPEENTGVSSLLPGAYDAKGEFTVETRRLDDFVREKYPQVQNIAIWMDVESVEYEVLEGMQRELHRVSVIHAETALEPVRTGQKTYPEIKALLEKNGFLFCGTNLEKGWNVGDVVFIHRDAKERLGAAYGKCMRRARFCYWLPLGDTAVFLKKKFPWLYRPLRSIYIKLAT